MRSTRQLPLMLQGTVTSRFDASALLKEPGDAALVERGRPRLLVIRCPDGCGEDVVVNLDRQAGDAWRLYRTGNSITLFPSVWRDTGCESHFIVSKGRIYLFGTVAGDDDEPWGAFHSTSEEEVLSALSSDAYLSPETLADRVQGEPWEILAVCRRLARKHRVVEGEGKGRGTFRRL